MITTLIMFLPAVSGELPGLGRCAGTARSAADDHNAAYLLGNRTRGPLPGQHVLHIRRDLDAEAAQHEIAVLSHNHDVLLAALTDDHDTIIAATRRAWLGRQIEDVSPQFDVDQAARAIRERRAGIAIGLNGDALLGHAGILMGTEHDELRPSRTGSLFLAYDLKRYKAEARAQVPLVHAHEWNRWTTPTGP